MTRKVVEHLAMSKEHEELQVVTCFEEAFSKEDIKKMNCFSKKYGTLIFNQYTHSYEYKNAHRKTF